MLFFRSGKKTGKRCYREVGRECFCMDEFIVKDVRKSNQMVASWYLVIYNKYREFLHAWRNNDETETTEKFTGTYD